jgi:hypothetical protein
MEITIDVLKKYCYMLVACFAVFIISWEMFYNTDQHRYERSVQNMMQEDYNGVVVKKYIDKANHNSPMLRFSNKKEIAIFGRFYAVIKIGDSLIKNNNSLKILVYRGDSKLVLDINDALKKYGPSIK